MVIVLSRISIFLIFSFRFQFKFFFLYFIPYIKFNYEPLSRLLKQTVSWTSPSSVVRSVPNNQRGKSGPHLNASNTCCRLFCSYSSPKEILGTLSNENGDGDGDRRLSGKIQMIICAWLAGKSLTFCVRPRRETWHWRWLKTWVFFSVFSAI